MSGLRFDGFDATAGEKFSTWRRAALGHMAGKCDDKGYSLADHLLGEDQGGYAAGAPNQGNPLGLNPSDRAKYLKRTKESWSIIYRHTSDDDLKAILSKDDLYQQGAAAFRYLRENYEVKMLQSDLDTLDLLWIDTSILKDVRRPR